jgi:hypothetical protein
MTWKHVNFVLHWGVTPPGYHRPGRPLREYTVHLPPGCPGWAPPKAAVLLRGWARRGLDRTRRARWVTLGVAHRPRRWATAGTLRGVQLNLTARTVRRFAPREYDFGGWRYPVRGVTLLDPPWGAALDGETQLVRPRYV